MDAAVIAATKQDSLEIAAEDELLEEAIKLAAAEEKEMKVVEAKPMQKTKPKARFSNIPKCKHGDDISDRYIDGFLRAFLLTFEESRRSGRSTDQCMHDVYNATESYIDVWSNEIKLRMAIVAFLAAGTNSILTNPQGKFGPQSFALYANALEQHIEINLSKTKATVDYKLLIDLENGDDHTIVSFYKKRIPCSCLDEEYNEVKSMKKKGVCWNVNCTKKGMVDRSSLMCCARCNSACYCSIECQKVAWPGHKEHCDDVVERVAAFRREKGHSN